MIKYSIYISEDVIIDYYTRDIPSKTLAFTANGAWPRMIEDGLVVMDGMGYYGKEMFKAGYDVIAFKNKAYDYYKNLTPDIEYIGNKIKSLIDNKYENKIYFGGCASSWLSLALSKYAEFNTVLLMMPRNELLPEDCDNLGIHVRIDIDKEIVSDKCHYILCSNFNHAWDYENLLRFTNAIPTNNRTVLNIPDEPLAHDIMRTLKKHKIWKEFFYNIVKDGSIIKHKGVIKVWI